MNEEKIVKITAALADGCQREKDTCLCPIAVSDDCPFPEKLCTEVTPKDWLEWMEADE